MPLACHPGALPVASGANELAPEATRLDLQGLHVASDLLTVELELHRLRGKALMAGRTGDDHAEVRGPGERHRLGGGPGELHPGEVDAGGRAGYLAHLHIVHEQGGEDLHGEQR